VRVERCGRALWHCEQVPIGTVRDEILAVNHQLSERGLRVLAFAARDLDDAAMSGAEADPMAAVTDLVLVALVGIMDPLRTEAKDAVRVALDAGIDVRMITGDHTVTARAIADELGLGSGVITGTELQHLPDPEVIDRLPELSSPPGRRRGGDLRPELVQPRRGRAGDGSLQAGGDPSGSWRWRRGPRRAWSNATATRRFTGASTASS
jgi:hypothetical protein